MPDPTYTYNGYFLNVSLPNNDTAHVRDYDLNERLAAKGSLLTASDNAGADGLAKLSTVAAGTTGQLLQMGIGGVPVWADAEAASGTNNGILTLFVNSTSSTLMTANQADNTALTITTGSTNGAISVNGSNVPVAGLEDTAFTSISDLEDELAQAGFAKTEDVPAPANNGKLRISLNGTASDFFSADFADAATLTFATGSTNGAISVNGANIVVNGLGTAAFANTTAFDAAGAASTAEQNAKNYADGLISGLGSVMEVKGTTATVPTSTTDNETGDVWIVSNNGGANDGEEYVWTGSAWEMMGKNDIDLTDYVEKITTIAGVDLQDNITAAELAEALTPNIATSLNLGDLAYKDNVSVPADTFVTDISATANNQTITYVNDATKVSDWNGGSAEFQVENGILSLIFSGATATVAAAGTTSTIINVNTYSATKNSAMTLS